MVKVSRTRAEEAQSADRRAQDIGGLFLFFFGAACLLCLSVRQTGALLTGPIDDTLRLLAGTPGAYVVPILLMFVGSMFLIGYERLSLSHSSLGTLLLGLVFVTWQNLARVPYGPEWEHATAAQQQATLKSAGGILGWLFGTPLRAVVGGPISYLFLITLCCVALVLLVDQPFVEILRRMHQQSRAGARAAQTLTASARPKRAALPAEPAETKRAVPAPQRPAPAPALAGAEAGTADRASRAARVAERALGGGTATLPFDEEDTKARDDGAPDDSPDTGARLFNLFRSWRTEEPEEEEEPTRRPEDKRATAHTEAPSEAEKTEKPTGEKEKKPSKNAPPTKEEIKAEAVVTAVLDPVVTTQNPIPPFVLPPLTLLQDLGNATSKRSPTELTDKIKVLEQTLEQFNIGANVVEVASGPSVTRYEIQLAPGIKVSKIVSLADNIAMNLAAIDVRVEAPIPGKAAIGVEVPNSTPTMVGLRECLDQEEYRNAQSKLTVALGKDVAGQYKYADLTKMPHLLIGGSTNSGKSVCLNVLIASLVYRASPREVKMLMIDPKRVELSLWDGIPHLMHPVVKDVKQAAGIFRAALKEMDRRYDLFAAIGTRNIDGYNGKVPETERLPYLVLIVDELADLMMQQGPEIETSICRLAQLARATGIHLVIATQRPSVDIITGTIKANISSRIAFAVASQVDSRTILDMVGADRLIGRGDMLFMPIDAAKPLRIQGCYLSEGETNALVDYLKEQEKPQFSFTVSEHASTGDKDSGNGNGSGQDEDEWDDQFFEQAVRLVVNNGQASTSMLQRRFRIGYTRAARIVETMEEKGIVGPLNGAKPREILVSKDEVERMFSPGGAIPSVEEYADEGE